MNDSEIKRSVRLLSAVGGVGDDIINEASEQNIRSKAKSRRRAFTAAISGIAACFVLVAAVLAVMRGTWRNDQNNSDLSYAAGSGERSDGPAVDESTQYIAHQISAGVRIVSGAGSLAYRGYDTVCHTVSLILTLDRAAEDIEISFYGRNGAVAVINGSKVSGGLSVTVNGDATAKGIPTVPGTYRIDIDYSEFYLSCRDAGGNVADAARLDGFGTQALGILLVPLRVHGMPEPPASLTVDEFTDIDLGKGQGLY